MKFYSQKDPRWKNITIGSTSYTIGQYGCLICCWAMLTETSPEYIAKCPVFDSRAILAAPDTLASILGTSYNANRSVALYDPIICEVRIGSAQHFVVRYKGQIYDPYTLDGKPYKNYEILSYRNVKPKGDNMEWYLDPQTNTVYKYDPDFGVYYYINDPNKVPWELVKREKPSGKYLVPYSNDCEAALAACEKKKEELIKRNGELMADADRLKALFEDCSLVKDSCLAEKEKLEKQIKEHRCEVKELSAWEHFREFISKILKRS